MLIAASKIDAEETVAHGNPSVTQRGRRQPSLEFGDPLETFKETFEQILCLLLILIFKIHINSSKYNDPK